MVYAWTVSHSRINRAESNGGSGVPSHRRAVRKCVGNSRSRRERHTLTSKQALHPIRVASTVATREEQLTVYLAAILLDRTWHVHDAPHLRFAGLRAKQHRHQLDDIESIGLRPAPPAIDLNARGVDDAIRHAAAHEIAMQPEAIASGLVAAADRHRRRQAEVRFRPAKFRLESGERSRRDRAAKRRLIHAGRHPEYPLRVAELEGEI